jgi:hypothetical protein
VDGDQMVVEPLVAVMGTSIFTGRLEHRGERSNPWRFHIKANALSVEQGALWFDVLGHRPPLALLERVPGLSSLAARRAAASGLFTALNAAGQFEAPVVSYRSLQLEDFQASVEVSGRVVRVAGASFKTGGGRGRGRAEVDLLNAPARVTGDVTLAGAKLQALAARLPVALRKVHGVISGNARFATRGLTREEMSVNLEAHGTAQLRNVSFGDFDPLQALSRQAGWGALEPARSEVTLHPASVAFVIRNRRVSLAKQQLELQGAKLTFSGSYGFDGALDLDVRVDRRHLTRRWISTGAESSSSARVADVRLTGLLDKPLVAPEVGVSQATR